MATPQDSLDIHPSAAGAVLRVRVIPRAGRTGIAGVRAGALLVRLAAAPVDGAANGALRAELARALGVAQRDVIITSGATSRHKQVEVRGMTPSDLRERLRV